MISQTRGKGFRPPDPHMWGGFACKIPHFSSLRGINNDPYLDLPGSSVKIILRLVIGHVRDSLFFLTAFLPLWNNPAALPAMRRTSFIGWPDLIAKESKIQTSKILSLSLQIMDWVEIIFRNDDRQKRSPWMK